MFALKVRFILTEGETTQLLVEISPLKIGHTIMNLLTIEPLDGTAVSLVHPVSNLQRLGWFVSDSISYDKDGIIFWIVFGSNSGSAIRVQNHSLMSAWKEANEQAERLKS